MLTWPSSPPCASRTAPATMQRAHSNACLSICAKRTRSLTGGQCMNLSCATSHFTPRHIIAHRVAKESQQPRCRQWLSLIRSFFIWLNRNGCLLYNPAERLAFPRPEQSLPDVLNESKMARLIETPDTTTAIGLRDRALLETLYATGIRRREAHRLDLYDIDTAAQRLTVRLGKGQRDRLVPLTETAAHWLTRYLTAARPELAAGKWLGKGQRRGQPKLIPPTAALWLSVTGRRLSYQMIADRICDYALQAGVKASVHTFRHCCATHLLRGGASLRHVQQLLGHRTSIAPNSILTSNFRT